MLKPTVVFAHGRESGPWGSKIRALSKVAERHGCMVISKDDHGNFDPELRVSHMIQEVRSIDGPLILVGSSMGGYVTTVASKVVQPSGLFLMAPAFGLPGYAEQAPRPFARELEIVHGWDDDVVPLDAVLNFAREHKALLHLVQARHTLHEQLEYISQLFDLFLQRCFEDSCVPAQGRLLASV